MDRAAIRAQARNYLNDPAQIRWTDAELNGWINDGLTQWAQDTDQLQEGRQPLLDPDLPAFAFYTGPVDFQGIARVQWNGRELVQMGVPGYQNWEALLGQPVGFIMGPYGPNKFRLYPYIQADQSTVLRVYGTHFAPALAADIDVPAIPEAYQRALVYYCLAEAYLKDSDDTSLALSDRWRGRYAEQVQMAKRQDPVTPGFIWSRYP